MIIQDNIIKDSEKYDFSLRALYANCGYRLYRMSKFEEYDLYARNRNFLSSGEFISFTDTNGKLMALKPDITLSIAKNVNVSDAVQKIYYSESVYRVSRSVNAFREITQIGVECIGSIKQDDIEEVLLLAANSLLTISPDFVLEISDLDLLLELCGRLGLDEALLPDVFSLIADKNTHDLLAFCREKGADQNASEALALLIKGGSNAEMIQLLKSLSLNKSKIELLSGLLLRLSQNGFEDKIRIDFSITGDINYYEGTVFRGFILGKPGRVLSGGRYDRLLKKLGKNSGAIGFAVYLDAL